MKVTVSSSSGDLVSLAARGLSGVEDIYFRSSQAELAETADAGLTAALTLAMSRGEPLEIMQPISRVLSARADDYQALISRWYPRLKPVQVLAATRQPARAEGSETFCFFSGGVDSFYTLLRNIDRVDAAVYVHGFDVSVDDTALRSLVAGSLRRTMNGLGKELIELETDLRRMSDPHVTWPAYVSSGLATVAHVLSRRFNRALIAGTLAYHELQPLASHPLTDPLLSGDQVAIEHHGCDATRHDKVAFIARHPMVQQNLRVCWENPDGDYNCGRCEKCLRTMLGLEALGVLDEFTCFPSGLDIDVVRQIDLAGRGPRHWAVVNLRELRRANRDPKLVRALAEAIARSDVRRVGRLARRQARRNSAVST
ncbi:hypothetical protein CC117_05770 [Parafrankia colletiae]|uniref:Uncharacterized protein n=2 Tax=Parafrankia colletiae TaxID=573497 RepID=A0A1S1QB53_9ACTN|nr:hypothetical protein [Frankia sp. Cpl3]OHV30691.1 hypothetical protein CC117_05770 [Parafrankia colletiae]